MPNRKANGLTNNFQNFQKESKLIMPTTDAAVRKITAPKVTITVPKVTLRLDDLTYLRSMDSPDKIKCIIPESKKQRLRILRLIETINIAPTKEKIALAEADKATLLVKLKEVIAGEQWGEISNLGYELKRTRDRMQPVPTDVITEQGRRLLDTGSITVMIKKTGCL